MPKKNNDIKHFNFEREKVLAFSRTYKTEKESIDYLQKILRLRKTNKTIIDHSLDDPEFDFEVEVKAEIKRLRKNAAKPNIKLEANNAEKFVWLKNKQDLIFLYDNLISMGFIADRKNKDKFLAAHFTYPHEKVNPTNNKAIRRQLKNHYLNPSQEIQRITEELKKTVK